MGNKVSRNYQGNCDISFCVKCRDCLVFLHCKGGVDFSNSQEEQELRTRQELSRSDTNTMRSWDSQLPTPLPTVQIHYILMIFGSVLHIYVPSAHPLCYDQNQPGTRLWSPPLKYVFSLGLLRRNVDPSPSFSYPFSNAIFCYRRKISKRRSTQEMLNSWWKLGNDSFCCCFEVFLSHTFAFGLSWTKPVASPKVLLDTVMISSIISNLNDIYKKPPNSLTDMAATVHICQSLIFVIIFPMNTL